MADGRILLHNGRLIDPLNMRPEDVDLNVPIVALSRLPRYSGQTRKTYRVAEHVVKLWRVVPERLKRAALLHDCSEGFGLLDFAHPVKCQIPQYSGLENSMLKQIFDACNVPWELMYELEPYDRRMSQDEMMQVFDTPFDRGMPPLGVKVEFWSERKCQKMLRRAFVQEGLLHG
ncbi:hypothetical protein RZ532_06215 [Nitratireductor aquimarinus]|uniref:hypothetical protein n=1 Tax=Nitratireductor aquimarinus TaxID=889300 RepID=UPI0029363017|nr:hypothetical protein [Nitratireductor aquimarinus]MDV2965559.1 hypothetical protein [Nitratireductor aquimarinus]